MIKEILIILFGLISIVIYIFSFFYFGRIVNETWIAVTIIVFIELFLGFVNLYLWGAIKW